jgi:hypothetical protein
MSKKIAAGLEAALLLNGRFKKSFDKLPLAVQRLARPAFSFGKEGPLLWDLYTPTARLSRAQRWVFEHNPANDRLRDKIWELGPAITRKLKQLDDEISLLETAPPTLAFDSDTREAKILKTRLKREALKADEAEYLAAAAPELHSAVERLVTAHPYLMTPSEPVAQSSEPASRQVSEQRQKPLDRSVRLWFQNRVKTWPDAVPAPSEAADWKAINQHFAPGLSREVFRLARREETPLRWHRQGPRPIWGDEKKSAG